MTSGARRSPAACEQLDVQLVFFGERFDHDLGPGDGQASLDARPFSAPTPRVKPVREMASKIIPKAAV